MDAFFLALFRRSLEPNDSLDLVAGFGALQILPENAHHLLRLEVGAAVASGLSPTADLPALSNQRWRVAVNGPPLADPGILALEDLAEHPFTEALTFHGGSYVIFPGLEADAPYILRELAHTVFRLPPPVEDPWFNEEAYCATRAALVVSDAVARRAGLGRNAAPGTSPNGTVTVPFPAEFARLKDAVSFDADELEALLGPAGLGLDALAPFVCEQGAPTVAYQATAPLPMLLTPVVRSGDRYVVASPGALPIAIRHHLIRLAIQRGLRDQLADRFREAVFRNVGRSVARYLGCPPVPIPPFDFGGLPVDNRCYALDIDKVLNVVVVIDRLDGYDPANPFGAWNANTIVDAVQERLREVEEHVFAAPPAGKANEILHLIVVQGVGRFHTFGIDRPQEPVNAHRVALSASDLEIFGLRMGGQQLALWQFAEAAAAARESARIVGLGTLDEVAYFLANGEAYFHSDEVKPAVIWIPPGGAGLLHQEVAERFDTHAVPGPDGNTLVEVGRIDPELGMPSYAPIAPSTRAAVLNEVLPLRVWVVGPDAVADERYEGWYRELARMLVYWLWQVAPSLGVLAEALADRMNAVVIRLEVEPSEAWFAAGSDAESEEAPGIVCVAEADGIRLMLAASALPLFERADNAGEREILRAVLRALADLAEVEPNAWVDDVVDRHAPVGPKKMILRLRLGGDRRLDDRGVGPARFVQEADANAVMDETGRFLSRDRGLPVGPIVPADRVPILNAVVDYQLTKLESLVATLCPDGLLEALIADNEALIQAQAVQRLTVPTRLACFGEAIDVVEDLQRNLTRLSGALVSSRFLLEYVAARPPAGLRPVSLAVYDRILAIASEIVDRSIVRDAVALGLADPELDVLPSGRLGVEREAYEAALRALAGEYAFGEAGRSSESFPRHWEKVPNPELVAALEAMDGPTREEFGLTLRELLQFLSSAMEYGDGLPGAGKSKPYAEFVANLAAALGWSIDQTAAAVEVFASRSRARFLEPPPPYDRIHVSAANFARPFSCLRRPLILRPASDGDEVLWGNRNLSMAGAYLWDLLQTARYPAQSDALSGAMARAQQGAAEAFNDRVADLFSAIPGAIVRTRVVAVGGKRIQRKKGHDLGDIDVLVVEPNRKVVRAVEVKDFAGARTPWEFKRELAALFGPTGGQSTVDKHGERVRWLANHRADMLAWLGLPVHDADDWRVDPLIVLDKESPTPFLASVTMPVTTYQRLKAKFSKEQGG